MNRYAGLTFTVLALVFLAGCASKNSNVRQINSLQAQINTIADELARIDYEMEQTRGAIQMESNRRVDFEQRLSKPAKKSEKAKTSLSGLYRTPSGFELPSIEIQKALKNAGYYQGSVDGKIGSGSRRAIKAFQRDHGLEADGVVGRRTWGKLKAYLPGRIK